LIPVSISVSGRDEDEEDVEDVHRIVFFADLLLNVYRRLLCCSSEVKSYLWESCSAEGARERALDGNINTSFFRRRKSAITFSLTMDLDSAH
jgi:hypothetical protein